MSETVYLYVGNVVHALPVTLCVVSSSVTVVCACGICIITYNICEYVRNKVSAL